MKDQIEYLLHPDIAIVITEQDKEAASNILQLHYLHILTNSSLKYNHFATMLTSKTEHIIHTIPKDK